MDLNVENGCIEGRKLIRTEQIFVCSKCSRSSEYQSVPERYIKENKDRPLISPCLPQDNKSWCGSEGQVEDEHNSGSFLRVAIDKRK
ncbi:hypothetical protein GQ457_10G021260 [Hibiscus cannabinus]